MKMPEIVFLPWEVIDTRKKGEEKVLKFQNITLRLRNRVHTEDLEVFFFSSKMEKFNAQAAAAVECGRF